MSSERVNGPRLRQLREERRLTLRELAILSGRDSMSIQKYETGRQANAQPETLKDLARALKVPISELIMPEEGSAELSA